MAKNNLKTLAYTVVAIGLIGVISSWSTINKKSSLVSGGDSKDVVMSIEESPSKKWNEAGVGCISGHSAIAVVGQHIHQTLKITVDGRLEPIIGDIGIIDGCMAEAHVHAKQDNVIHVESVDPQKKLKLTQFLAVYDKSLARDGYSLGASLNGIFLSDPENLILEDHQVIELKYTKSSI